MVVVVEAMMRKKGNNKQEAIMARSFYQCSSEPSFMAVEALRLTQIARL